MPDLSEESIGKKSQKPKKGIAKRELGEHDDEHDQEAKTGEDNGDNEQPPEGEQPEGEQPEGEQPPEDEIQSLPDIISENDVKSVPKGKRFLARFLNDPTGDTGQHARQIMPEILNGTVVRHGLSRTYWTNHSQTRPPMAMSEGGGKYHVVEA